MAEEAAAQLARVFTPATVDELRAATGYNPRQRQATAYRLLAVVVHGYLLGQTLGFARLRAFFVKMFGPIRPRAFQLRFKQAEAAAFFRAALGRMVETAVGWASISLEGPLAMFDDVRVYDGTGQRVPPRGRSVLPACTAGQAGAKWMVGYSLKTGLLDEATVAAETTGELPLWRTLVPSLQRGVLYLLDLGFFERALFAQAQTVGAHLVMRLKSNTKVTVLGHMTGGHFVGLQPWSLAYYLSAVGQKRGTSYDLDIRWGKGASTVHLRLVGVSLGGRRGLRFYLTTVPRNRMSAAQIIEVYRLRWTIEFLFRELKQESDLGRSFTADPHAIAALTYGAMLGHVLVRSLRLVAALRHAVPLEQLRPLACAHLARAFAAELIDALFQPRRAAWHRVVATFTDAIVAFAREAKPSRSRDRVTRRLGAVGA